MHSTNQPRLPARSIQRFIQNQPMEAMGMLAITPFAYRFVKNIIRATMGNTNDNHEQEVELEEVKLRGKTFLSTASKGDQLNLGWTGAFPYYVPVMLLALEAFGMARHGEEHFLRKGLTPAQRGKFQLWLFFGLLPLADMVIGTDWLNPTTKQTNERRLAWRFRLPLYMWVAVSMVMNLVGYRIALGKTASNSLTMSSRVAIFLNLALLNGVFGINISHELLHKQSQVEKMLGNLLLVFVNYVHWGQEHLDGHHEHVATPLDPATARRGENLYAFLPRTMIGSFKSSCALEQERLGEGRWYTTENRIFRGAAASFAWSLILAKYSKSKMAIPIFYSSALLSVALLEVVNYMEHYSLERRKDAVTGKYEVVDPRHSWNSPNWLSNTILFKLQRHSDHHAFASRPYEILRNFVESPQLPTGYIGMFVLSLVPPLFFQVMDPLVEAHRLEFNPDREPNQEEMDKANAIKATSRMKMWVITTNRTSMSAIRQLRDCLQLADKVDNDALEIMVKLVELGVDPDALAKAVKHVWDTRRRNTNGNKNISSLLQAPPPPPQY